MSLRAQDLRWSAALTGLRGSAHWNKETCPRGRKRLILTYVFIIGRKGIAALVNVFCRMGVSGARIVVERTRESLEGREDRDEQEIVLLIDTVNVEVSSLEAEKTAPPLAERVDD